MPNHINSCVLCVCLLFNFRLFIVIDLSPGMLSAQHDSSLETFSRIIIERQEVRTLLNLEILGRMIPLRLTMMINLEKK